MLKKGGIQTDHLHHRFHDHLDGHRDDHQGDYVDDAVMQMVTIKKMLDILKRNNFKKTSEHKLQRSWVVELLKNPNDRIVNLQ